MQGSEKVRYLNDEIGGSAKLDEITSALYERVAQDSTLSSFFEGVDLIGQKRKMRLFLSTLAGRPQKRSSIELQAAHAHAVGQGLSHEHFDAFVGHLRKALEDTNVRSDLIEDLLFRVMQTRSDVLGL